MNKLITLSFIFLLAGAYSCKTPVKLGKKDRIVQIDTEYGAVKIQLYDETPGHRDNFIKLAHQGFFDGTLFHRVIDGFMIQGGDPDSKGAKPGTMLGEGGPGYDIPAEFHPNLFHKKGVIAAAREGDSANPKRESSGSQFYIAQGKVYEPEALEALVVSINKKRANAIFENQRAQYKDELTQLQKDGEFDKFNTKMEEMKHNIDSISKSQILVLTDPMREAYSTVGGIPHLDQAYTVFGEVIEGLDIIDKIASEETDGNDRPLKDMKMKVTIVQ
ncbi:peptidylprolyl isomerase [Ancylomarina euxinus]|uniref:Peptidyl-prolyl cis-trans isomerase n=1 Tax=Ancylomarina euxinus TaxID=2283627 RepID=A0A425Y7L9_9BACT|nr:peptidylprolyl isomerase [Ancylomarina euxinus]MCZ4693667.1 peptidylprolyl isomerase [Ancylomarina euxinus]MUP13896.1 peptidylprolyl isomerase [Ancylomarina euxinus]RRG24476.1 peptidylprolyl isomerase [Ancylomarina euxinus]